MAEFIHKITPTYGACTTCGTSVCADGFVDLIAETNITRDSYQIVGNVDVVLCADCITQAARVVGCIPAKEAEDLRESNSQIADEYSKALDDIYSWQQRYENLVGIMSLLELAPKVIESDGVDSDNDIVSSPSFVPSVDTRVQESGELPVESPRAVSKRRKNARG